MRYLAIRDRVYPTDLNPNGTAFGGFIMSQMDKAASIMVEEVIVGKAVTVFVDKLHFNYPLHNGDIYSVYAEVVKLGHTSITMHITFESKCGLSKVCYNICDANFVFVAINDKGKPISIKALLRPDAHQWLEGLEHETADT